MSSGPLDSGASAVIAHAAKDAPTGYWTDTIEGRFDRILEPSGLTHAQLAAAE